MIEKIGKIYQEYIEPHIYFIFLIIIISIEGGDKIVFKHYFDVIKLFKNFIPFIRLNLSKLVKGVGKLIKDKDKDNEYSEIFFETDFGKDFYELFNNEELQMQNLFVKIREKKILFSKQDKEKDNQNSEKDSNLNYFSEYSEKEIIGNKYYVSFLELLNKYSSDYPEDIEISIYNNLKQENENRKTVFNAINELMEEFIKDEESKKGFLALVRQSFLLGKLRNEVVRIYI